MSTNVVPEVKSSVKDFLKGRSGQRDVQTVTIGGREIPLRSLSYRERTAINLKWYEAGDGDTREDAREMRAALMLQQSILEDDRTTLAFTDSEEDLRVILDLRSKDADAFDGKTRELNFAAAENLSGN